MSAAGDIPVVGPVIGGPAPAAGMREMLRAFVRGDYARNFLARVAVQAFAVIVLIEAIFLAEHFTWVFRDAVRHEAALGGIAVILALSSTEIFDLALAIAILMAAYSALLRMRENREMLVLFASGLGPVQLSALILAVAVIGQVVCMVGSGIVDPVSRYAQRGILFSSELHSLKKGVAKGEFYYFPSYVAYAVDHVEGAAPPPTAPGQMQVIDARPQAPKPAHNQDRTLFVYQQIAPHTSRVVTAAQARLDGPDRNGRIVLNLNDFTSHTFADAHPLTTANGQLSHSVPMCKTCLDELKDIPRVTMKVRDMSQMMMVDQLLPFNARSSIPEEQTIFEQLLRPDPVNRAAQMRLLAERFSRSLLSFLAPLMALLAVSATNRLTNWFALPFACLGLMSVNLGCEWLITTIAPMRVSGALLPVFLLYAAVAWLVLSLTVWRHNNFVRPQLARS